ncbi:MATE family efflux transporter [Oxalobacter paraformigenes]|uniref:Multidrug-efflux transporter n=1 Tax=Oxalobacter paraformigenes TaxID=556268 RepID=C3X410_9BURK|nr:MATE family efflux transporter [Oxalobacter paraformigenes]EEO27946.1 MATE efflux family protein [Oxalobacter paraformigenes]
MNLPASYADHFRKLIALGVPIIIGQIGMIVLGFADTIMIGHYSTESLGAASFVNNLFNLVIIGSTGFAYGLTPVIGELFGSGDRACIGGKLKNALFVNFTVAIVFTLAMTVLFFNIDRLDQPAELIPLIEPYYLVLLASLVFILLFNAFRQFADGIMDTRTSMWILLSGNLLNIIGNYVLIYGVAGFPELGLVGAGLSTLFSRIVMLGVFVAIFFCLPRYRDYKNGFIRAALNRADFRKLNALGWPLALQMGMETASFSLTTIMVGWLGTIALAAHQVMLTVSTLFFMMYYGMGAATAVRVSYFRGQERPADVRRAAFSGFYLIMMMAIASTTLFWQFRFAIGNWFTGNTAVLGALASLFPIMMIYQFGDSLQIAFANALRGIMDVKIMMLFSFLAYFVISLSASYVFGFVMDYGLTGIWMAFPLGLTSAGAMFWLRFLCKTRQARSGKTV